MIARNHKQEVFAEQERNSVIHQWMKDRVANIHNRITAADVLSYHGIVLYKQGVQEEQFSCPFHGQDKKPSARYYPQSSSNLSSVWCFVCREKWDALALWKKFNGETKFSEILFNIERAFGITPPLVSVPSIEDEYDPLQDEVNTLFEACENRLREGRDKFDIQAHLRIGSILDQLRYAVEKGFVSLGEGKNNLEKVVTKIGEKVRAKKLA
jgi:hypothetical protein